MLSLYMNCKYNWNINNLLADNFLEIRFFSFLCIEPVSYTHLKPQVSLNHYWTIDDKSTLTTSLYGSMATGGGRRARGAMSNWLTIDRCV